jgi:hypothetical protein
MLALFGKLRSEDEEVCDCLLRVLRARSRHEQESTKEQRAELQRQFARIEGQRNQLLNLRLLDQINADTFASKDTELRDRVARIKLQIDVLDRGQMRTSTLQ